MDANSEDKPEPSYQLHILEKELKKYLIRTSVMEALQELSLQSLRDAFTSAKSDQMTIEALRQSETVKCDQSIRRFLNEFEFQENVMELLSIIPASCAVKAENEASALVFKDANSCGLFLDSIGLKDNYSLKQQVMSRFGLSSTSAIQATFADTKGLIAFISKEFSVKNLNMDGAKSKILLKKIPRADGHISRSYFYIRECYPSLAAEVFRTSRDGHVCVSGDPGLGKSFFSAYCFFVLIKLRKKCAHFSQDGSVLLYDPMRDDIQYFASTDILNSRQWIDPKCWALIDGSARENPFCGKKDRAVVFASPQKRNYYEFLKNDGVMLYMPPWIFPEICDLIMALPNSDVKFLYRKLYDSENLEELLKEVTKSSVVELLPTPIGEDDNTTDSQGSNNPGTDQKPDSSQPDGMVSGKKRDHESDISTSTNTHDSETDDGENSTRPRKKKTNAHNSFIFAPQTDSKKTEEKKDDELVKINVNQAESVEEDAMDESVTVPADEAFSDIIETLKSQINLKECVRRLAILLVAEKRFSLIGGKIRYILGFSKSTQTLRQDVNHAIINLRLNNLENIEKINMTDDISSMCYTILPVKGSDFRSAEINFASSEITDLAAKELFVRQLSNQKAFFSLFAGTGAAGTLTGRILEKMVIDFFLSDEVSGHEFDIKELSQDPGIPHNIAKLKIELVDDIVGSVFNEETDKNLFTLKMNKRPKQIDFTSKEVANSKRGTLLIPFSQTQKIVDFIVAEKVMFQVTVSKTHGFVRRDLLGMLKTWKWASKNTDMTRNSMIYIVPQQVFDDYPYQKIYISTKKELSSDDKARPRQFALKFDPSEIFESYVKKLTAKNDNWMFHM